MLIDGRRQAPGGPPTYREKPVGYVRLPSEPRSRAQGTVPILGRLRQEGRPPKSLVNEDGCGHLGGGEVEVGRGRLTGAVQWAGAGGEGAIHYGGR